MKIYKMEKILKKEVIEIGNKLGVNWDEVNLEEFAMGINVEFEHGTRFPETNVTNDNIELTAKIAWAHLKEFPDYYTRLNKMEHEAETYWENINSKK